MCVHHGCAAHTALDTMQACLHFLRRPLAVFGFMQPSPDHDPRVCPGTGETLTACREAPK